MTKAKEAGPEGADHPFGGDGGIARLADELSTQMLLGGIAGLAEDLAAEGEVVTVSADETIIEQGGREADVFFILAGRFAVIINRKEVAVRGPGDSVGEMTWISPLQRRSATVTARTDGYALKVSAEIMERLGEKHPRLLRRTAREIAKRLLQRNELLRAPNAKPRVFVISSAEALPVARAIENAFAHDPFLTVVWANGVFRVTSYTLETLERELEAADFAIAIAHPDDVAQVRDVEWPTPRDNVVFELGFFMGSLGRDRAILMEPRGKGVKLPSDLAGITTINYRFDAGADGAALIAPACNNLREHIMVLGVRT